MTNPDDNHVVTVLDENSRRYYLDAMGIQCWQLLESESASLQTTNTIEKGVVEQDVVCDVGETERYEVLSRGNTSAEIMFVLLSPNANDITTGELCSGEEGALLTKMLAAINVPITGVYITSLLQSRSSVGSAISESDVVRSSVHLKKQIREVKPKVLISLGEKTAQFLLKQKIPLDTLREQTNLTSNHANHVTSTYESTPLFISYSPAELLQKTENKRKAWSDLQQLQQFLQK